MAQRKLRPDAQKIPRGRYVRLRGPVWAVFDNRNTPWLVSFATSKRKSIRLFMEDMTRGGVDIKGAENWSWWHRTGNRCEQISLKMMKV